MLFVLVVVVLDNDFHLVLKVFRDIHILNIPSSDDDGDLDSFCHFLSCAFNAAPRLIVTRLTIYRD